MKWKVLITDYLFKTIEYERKILSEIGAEVI